MEYRFFTLSFDPGNCNFDDTELRDFMKNKNIISCTEQFFMYQSHPYWGIVVKYIPQKETRQISTRSEHTDSQNTDSKEEYKKVLREEDWPLFQRLKEFRSKEAEKINQAVYTIANNMKLAKIARNRPKKIEALHELKIGYKTIQKYGQIFLNIVQNFEAGQTEQPKTEQSKTIVQNLEPIPLEQSKTDQTKTAEPNQEPKIS